MVSQLEPMPESTINPTKSKQTPTMSILLTSFVESSFFFFAPMFFSSSLLNHSPTDINYSASAKKSCRLDLTFQGIFFEQILCAGGVTRLILPTRRREFPVEGRESTIHEVTIESDLPGGKMENFALDPESWKPLQIPGEPYCG
jgi:hypothetical protein